ncbi:MAG TPA: hypothetical protein DCM71_11055 [Runella sp.]|nr:hypothetical protein [Runella sp.]
MKTKILLTVTCLLWHLLAWGQKATIVKDIWPGQPGSDIISLIPLGNKVIFNANNGINNGVNENKLWITDGTENGTVKLNDTPLGFYPYFFKFNNIITYNATDPQGKVKLFRTDGTEKGTFQIWDRDYSYWKLGLNLLSVDNRAYWVVDDNLDGNGIFIQKDLNSFEAITILNKNVSSDIISFTPPGNVTGSNNILPFGQKWLFYAFNSKNTSQSSAQSSLYISDGTVKGTQKLPFPTAYLTPNIIIAETPFGLNGFFTYDGALWKTDGTALGTRKVKDITYDKLKSPWIEGRQVKNGIIFMSNTARDLWFSDGTENGTKLIKAFSSADDYIFFLKTPDDNKPFFFDPSTRQLWRTDGTLNGTKFITQLRGGFSNTAVTKGVLREGNNLYILDGGFSRDIIRINLETDITMKVGVINNYNLLDQSCIIGDNIFYLGDDTRGRELWKVSLSPCSHTVKINTPNGTSFCSGSSVKINAEPNGNTGPYTYIWKKGNEWGREATLSVTQAGNYTVEVTDKDGCTVSASVDITQTTNLPVSITGANSFCAGQTTTLTANATGGVSPYTYQWKQNSVNVGTNATTYAASAVGSYSVAVTDSKGCTGTSAAYSVTQKPSPNVTVSSSRTPTLLTGESVVLSVPTAAGQTYQWAKDGGAISGATNNSYTVSGAGSYTVTVTGSGCTATSSAVMVSIILANEPLTEEIGLRVSPNPAINQAKIVLQLAQSASANVYVLDASGKRVRTWESGGKATRHEVMLDMRSVAAGNYVVQAEAEGQVFTEKLVKQ